MRKRRVTILAGAAVILAALGVTLFVALPASAHGAMTIPGSRTFLCYEDAITPTGQIEPHNPACASAIAQSGPSPLYNWFAVGNRSGTTSGGTVGFIPDGKLCSGNSNYYDFSGFDQASPDWPKTHLSSGATIQIKYNKWAAHPGTFSLYVTKSGWDQTQPLTWDDLESTPFSTVTDPPSVGDPGSIDSYYYYWNATLPAGLTGYHIIYSVWARSDSSETFYGCSDVLFDGGNGEVTGIGSTAPPPPTTPCSATYDITNTWPGGFQGEVTVSNPTTSTLSGWTVSWVTANDETLTSAWNGTLSQSGSLATVTNADWNNVLAPGGSTTFGFTANQTSAPTVPTDLSCQSAGGNGSTTPPPPPETTTPPPPPESTTPPPPPTCSATYAVTNAWPGGFQGEVTVSNPTTSTLNGWTVSWVTANDETVTSAWNGTLSQSGSLATVTNADWNNVLAPGGSATFGFTANQTSAPTVPTDLSCRSS